MDKFKRYVSTNTKEHVLKCTYVQVPMYLRTSTNVLTYKYQCTYIQVPMYLRTSTNVLGPMPGSY